MSDLRTRLQDAIAEKFTIERELGGGRTRAYVATDVESGERVVIKVVAPEQASELFADRFAREVKFASRLQHDLIVPLLAAGDAGGVAYYTMPYVEGTSLRARLATGEPIPHDEAIRILRDVAVALEYAHRSGVVHRDVRPENVLLSSGGALTTDFGITKAIANSRTMEISTESPVSMSMTLTSAGSSLGTPQYMAPEQAAGDVVDNRADLYAWGLMAYEVLTGAHPFAGKATHAQMLAAQLAEMPPPIGERVPALAPRVAEVIMRSLEKESAKRPVSAEEVVAAIDDEEFAPRWTPSSNPVVEEHFTRTSTPPTHHEGVDARPVARSTPPVAIVLAVVLAAAIIGWLLLARRDAVNKAVDAPSPRAAATVTPACIA